MLLVKKQSTQSVVHSVLFLPNIPLIKRISALRAELRHLRGISRLPAAFIALVNRRARRTLAAALRTELSLVYRSAAASPAILSRFLLAALRTI